MIVDGLPDVLALQQVLSRYGHLMDARDWGGLDQVFTPDVVIDFTGFGIEPMHGLEEVRARFEVTRHPLAHHVTNVVVDVADDRANVRSKLLAVLDDGSVVTGDYDDIAVRTPNGWRVSRRVGVPRPQRSRRAGRP